MSFDQSLINRKDGIFAVAWLAGTSGSQSLSKYYKKNVIESINVPKTCDTLQRALSYEDLDSQDNVGKKGIPFRICTNLWFGALKIYQQQVNNLFKLSEDLVIGSSVFDTTEQANRTKSSQRTITKRKLTITHRNNYGDSPNINYSDILEDLDKFVQESQDSPKENESVQNNTPTRKTYSRPLAQLQIREITVREINAKYGIPEIDDDYGFGDANNEDIIHFFSFARDHDENHSYVMERSPTKRKSAYADEPNKKERRLSNETHYSNNYLKNKESSKRKSASEDVAAKKQRRLSRDSLSEISHNGSINPINIRSTTDEPPTSPCERMTYSEGESVANNITAIVSPNSLRDTTIKQEYDSKFEVNYLATNDDTTALKKTNIKEECEEMITVNKRKIRKLIIDHCIKIEEDEILEQLHKPHKDLRGITKNYFRKSKIKRISASELLKRCNKRTRLFCTEIKEKTPRSHKKSKQDYINLLRDILKIDYKEEWASEIYPKFNSPQKQMKHKTNKNDLGETINCNFLYENSNIVEYTDMDNVYWDTVRSLPSLSYQTPLKNVDANDNGLIQYNTSNEWRPYGVMAQLLKIWRYSIEIEINANDFCHSAKVQTNKALTFSSLLYLCKSRFIIITKRSKTIEMDKIMLGIAARKLMKTT